MEWKSFLDESSWHDVGLSLQFGVVRYDVHSTKEVTNGVVMPQMAFLIFLSIRKKDLEGSRV